MPEDNLAPLQRTFLLEHNFKELKKKPVPSKRLEYRGTQTGYASSF